MLFRQQQALVIAEKGRGYDKPKLAALITNHSNPLTVLEERLCAIVQLLAFSNFVLRRCCFTIIKPTAETWAFDMFQSLNATGTPLTAVETFKPMVSNYAEMHSGYKGSNSETYFNDVDNFLSQAKTANQKNRLTNEYLTTFALVQDGTKLPSQFSAQRRYLEEHYEACATPANHEEFMRRMSDLASYRRSVSDAPLNAQTRIPLTEGAAELERELAVMCVAYLKKANHKMADTMLSRFYSILRRADDNSRPAARDEFLSICKALAAFYTLWRAASSNSGLDDAYRKLLRIKEGDKMVQQGKLSWQGDPTVLTAANLKTLLRKALTDRHIGDKASWKNRAETELRYGNGVDQACRFSLLVTAHDTVPDPAQPGLMVVGQPGVQDYLRLEKWLSNDLSTIEHIAPQNSDARVPWDVALYDDEYYQRIGNQTLLPLEINVSAGNRGWPEKCLYYRYLVVQNPAVDRPLLEQEAQQQGITLTPQTLQRLETATHNAHIKPVAAVGMTGQWNRALVEARTQRICDLLWERIYSWLQ